MPVSRSTWLSRASSRVFASGRRATVAVFALAVAVLMSGCPLVTVADRLREDPRFSLLTRALEASGDMDRLEAEDDVTVFAPTDDAVNTFLTSQGITMQDFLGDAELAQVLRYHLADGKLRKRDLEAADRITTLEGRDISVRVDSDGVYRAEVFLNDRVRVTARPIYANNGVIYEIDAVLARPTRTSYESAPFMPINQGSITFDSITVTDPGFIRDLEVTLDLEHEAVFDLFIWLQNQDTGAFIFLVRAPFSGQDNLRSTLSDRAPFDVQDDVVPGFDDLEAYPEVAYRPFEPLELLYGESVTGTWTLNIFDVRPSFDGWLNRWSLDVTTTRERPDPDLALVRPRDLPTTLAQEFKETAAIRIKRLSGLTGPVDVTLDPVAGVTGGSITIADGEEFGYLGFGAEVTAVPGDRRLRFEARSNATTRRLVRSFAVDAEVVVPDVANIELVAQVPLVDLGAPGADGNDIWGWTDPADGTEYALVGTSTGTSFVRLTDPSNPEVVGFLPTQTSSTLWRDVKVYADHAFIVSEASGHGMQVFDLTQLRGLSGPVVLSPTAHFAEFGNAHNIAIDEESGFAYVVGATEDTFPAVCDGGLFMIDIRTPASPTFAGCFAGGVPAGQTPGPDFPEDAYVHDAQCLVYRGPDADYQGREICITSDGQINSDSRDYLGIADVTDKANPVQVSRITYTGAAYSHQGWLTEDQAYFLLNDEGDETEQGVNTRTYVFDVRDLDAPVLVGTYLSPRDSIGHNTYTHGGMAYQANYTSGLRIVDLAGVDTADLAEVAYFDTHPEDDAFDDGTAFFRRRSRCSSGAAAPKSARVLKHPGETRGCGVASFNGAWSNYPYFDSGIIIVSDMERGLFVLRATMP